MDDDEALLREIDSDIRLHDLVVEDEQDFSRSFGGTSFGIGKENQKNAGATNLNRFTLEELSSENLYDVQASGAGGTGFDSGPPRGRTAVGSGYAQNLASYAARLGKTGAATGSGNRLGTGGSKETQTSCSEKGKGSHDGSGASARLYKLGLRDKHKKDEIAALAQEEEERRIMRSKPEMSARSRSLTGGRKPNETHHGNYGHFLYEQGLKEKEKKQQASNAMHQVCRGLALVRQSGCRSGCHGNMFPYVRAMRAGRLLPLTVLHSPLSCDACTGMARRASASALSELCKALPKRFRVTSHRVAPRGDRVEARCTPACGVRHSGKRRRFAFALPAFGEAGGLQLHVQARDQFALACARRQRRAVRRGAPADWARASSRGFLAPSLRGCHDLCTPQTDCQGRMHMARGVSHSLSVVCVRVRARLCAGVIARARVLVLVCVCVFV
jgi:hypothetical protein